MIFRIDKQKKIDVTNLQSGERFLIANQTGWLNNRTGRWVCQQECCKMDMGAPAFPVLLEP
jgi:hypothetical protein